MTTGSAHVVEVVANLLKHVVHNAHNAGAHDIRLLEKPRTLHTVFHQAQREFGERLPELNQLHFMTIGSFPYSHDLAAAIEVIHTSGSMSRENPSYERFSMASREDTASVLRREWEELVGGSEDRKKALDGVVALLSDELLVK